MVHTEVTRCDRHTFFKPCKCRRSNRSDIYNVWKELLVYFLKFRWCGCGVLKHESSKRGRRKNNGRNHAFTLYSAKMLKTSRFWHLTDCLNCFEGLLILKLIRTGWNCENLINSKEKYGSANSWSRVKNNFFCENSTFFGNWGTLHCYAANETRRQSFKMMYDVR
jgi:hypothetical protein